MRILLVPSSYPPRKGGVENAVSNVARHLQQRGHQVTVVTPSDWLRFSMEVEPSGVVVYRMPLSLPHITLRMGYKELWRSLLRSLVSLVSAPVSLTRLVSLLRAMRPDVVNVHYIYENALFCLAARQVTDFRLVVTIHGEDIERHFERARIGRWMVSRTLKAADRVLSNSAYLLAGAALIYPGVKSKSAVVGNGVNPGDFASVAAFHHPRKYVLSVARFVPKKGMDVLIRAFSLVHQCNPDLDLFLGGTGPEYPGCVALARELGIAHRVRFFGELDFSAVPSLVRGCELFVLPSRREPFGIAVLEAMTARKPVIATRVGGIPEIVTHGESGLLVEPDRPEELAGAMQRLLDNRELGQRLAETGYHEVRDKFTWEQVVGRYLAQYQLVLEEKAR